MPLLMLPRSTAWSRVSLGNRAGVLARFAATVAAIRLLDSSPSTRGSVAVRRVRCALVGAR